jgi:hypothetical protein
VSFGFGGRYDLGVMDMLKHGVVSNSYQIYRRRTFDTARHCGAQKGRIGLVIATGCREKRKLTQSMTYEWKLSVAREPDFSRSSVHQDNS